MAADYPPELLQILVVNDGSTDGTLECVEQWRGLLPLDIVRHDRNRGVAAGRMTAVGRLRTDLVLSIDGDDVWLPHHLTLLLRAYEARPGIVSPNAVPWKPASPQPIAWGHRLQPVPKARDRDLAHLLVENWVFTGSLFERGAYEAAGGQYRYRLGEDWDLWIRLMSAGAPVTVVDEPTVLYRVHEGSLSANDKALPEEVQVLQTFLEECADPALRAVARRSLRHRFGRLALREAYDKAGRRRRTAARLTAAKALGGPPGVRWRATAMMFAPVYTAGRRDRTRSASFR